MIDTKAFYDTLIEKNMDFFTGVPDSLLANICACIKQNAPDDRNIIAANEGNAVGIACGLAGRTRYQGRTAAQEAGKGDTGAAGGNGH